MKGYIILLLSLLLVWACAVEQPISIREMANEEDSDSVEYELIVFDSGFESWFTTRAKPVNYHEQSWYEHWNRLYVLAWNNHHLGGRYARLIDGMINYEPDVDYGLEINHKLFYYFMYVEHELDIPIIPDGPRSW
ncbi:MAG: DUF6146 family protein [Mangrovibacterium sp.]